MNWRPLKMVAKLTPGQLLGDGDRYEVVGEMPDYEHICIARDRKLDVTVVLKFFQIGDGGAEARFRKEAALLAQLRSHPNIVTILDTGDFTWDEFQYKFIVLEHMDKGSLNDPSTLPTDYDDVLKVAVEAARGLAYAHEKGQLHRDVKAANFFWSTGQVVKIGDFECGKDPVRDGSSLTEHRPVGTRPFMAPEVLLGRKLDQLSDVFSFGVTLYKWFTGQYPFSPCSREHCNEHVQSIKSGPKDLREHKWPTGETAANLVESMIQYDHRQRPTMKIVLEKLEAELVLRRKYVRPTDELHFNSRPVRAVREALKEKVENAIKDLASLSSPVPAEGRDGDEGDWYSTISLRPSYKDASQDTPRQREYFHHIYIAHYQWRRIAHWSDWLETTDLLRKPTPVQQCCSGLPILMHQKMVRRKDLEKLGVLVKYGERDLIRYLAIPKLKWLRFERDRGKERNLIAQMYATDYPRDNWPNGVGWRMRDVETRLANHHMRQDLEVELIVPIYRPVRRNQAVTDRDVTGVVNVEWADAGVFDRIDEIGEELSHWIQEDHLVPASFFVSDVLRAVSEIGTQASGASESVLVSEVVRPVSQVPTGSINVRDSDLSARHT